MTHPIFIGTAQVLPADAPSTKRKAPKPRTTRRTKPHPDAPCGRRAAELLEACAAGIDRAFPGDVDAIGMAEMMRDIAERHRAKKRVELVLSVIS